MQFCGRARAALDCCLADLAAFLEAGWLGGDLASLYEYKSMLGCFIKDDDNPCFWSTEVEVRCLQTVPRPHLQSVAAR